jgi:WD40 repeat protein
MSDDGTRYEPPGKGSRPGDRTATAATVAAPGTGAGSISPSLPTVDRALYDLGEEVARGGLGRILQAVDRRLDRPVAIKELLHEGPDYAARFAREALLTARLQHPAIVPVYEAGTWPDGSPFYAMKLVSGKSLEAAVRERETLAERLTLLPHVIDVVEALAYAHEHHIIHRDLKPANVLVGAFGETVVIDWGLAKDLSSQDPEPPSPERTQTPRRPGGDTQAGSVLGTPAYMPPEQALGARVDERADVYALGALLYQVIAGDPPYVGVSSEHILTMVVREGPEPLTMKEPEAPPELVAIVKKAMARDPAQRYRTAAQLAEDLTRFQGGQLVGAHRYSRWTLFTRWVHRNRAPVTVGAAMLALLIAVVSVAFQRVVTERDIARAERAEAQRLRAQADQRGDELALREAEALLARDPRAALGWLARLSPESHATGAARVIAADALSRGVPQRLLAVAAYALAFSPDGALLAIARGGDVLVEDVASGQRLALAGRGGPERALAFSPDGARLAFAGLGGTVRVWDRPVRAISELSAQGAEVTALAFGDGNRLATVGRDGTLRIHDLGSGAPPRLLAAHLGEATDVAFAGAVIATAGADGTVKLWDAAADKGPLATIAHGAPIGWLRFSADGRRLATVAADGGLRLVDVAAREVVAAAKHDAAVTAAAWLGPELVATGDAGGKLWLWDRHARPRRLLGHEGEVWALAAAGERLISAGRDQTVRVWDVRTGRARVLRGHEGDVIAVAAAAGTGRVASASRDRTLRLWNLADGEPRVLAAPEGRARALVASADGARLAGATDDALWSWQLAAGVVQALTPPGGGAIRGLAHAPDGATLAAAGEDGRVVLYAGGGTTPSPLLVLDGGVAALGFDARSRTLAAGGRGGLRVVDVTAAAGSAPRVSDAEPVVALAFAPIGGALASAGQAVRLWDLDRRRAVALGGAVGPFTALAWSADGRRLAAGSADGVAVWTVASGAVERLPGPGAAPTALAFAGAAIVGTAADRSVRVWVPGRVAPPRVLAGLAGAPAGLVISPDGRSAAVASSEGGVRLWDVASGRGRSLPGHAGGSFALAFVDGGAALVSLGADGALRVWPDRLPHDREGLRAWLARVVPPE